MFIQIQSDSNNEKTAKKKRRASWFSRYFGQSSRPSSGDLLKIRIVVTIYSKTVTVVGRNEITMSKIKEINNNNNNNNNNEED